MTNKTIYLEIPLKYGCVYKKILHDLSSLGIKGLTEHCKNFSMPCNNISDISGDCNEITKIFDSWNMFQIACAAYDLGEISKADKIIEHINKKMSYCCSTEIPIIPEYENNIIYYGEANQKPILEEILAGKKFDLNTGNIFNTPIDTKGHFIVAHESVYIEFIRNSNFYGDWLFNPNYDIDLYTRESITIKNSNYVLWYCEFEIPFYAGIEVKIGG